MPHNVVLYQSAQFVIIEKQSSGTEIHNFKETLIYILLKYIMNNSVLIVSTCMGQSNRKNHLSHNLGADKIEMCQYWIIFLDHNLDIKGSCMNVRYYFSYAIKITLKSHCWRKKL